MGEVVAVYPYGCFRHQQYLSDAKNPYGYCPDHRTGAMLSQHPVDRTLLHPLLDQCRAQLTAAGIRLKLCTVLADSGYIMEENFARAEQQKLCLLAPLGKDPATHRIRAPQWARHLDRLLATARAARRMRITGAAPMISSAPRPSSRCSDRSRLA